MDSGNSGSLQSSSGGDEEYESRPDSISSSFINNNPSNNQIINPVFDPLSNFFDPRSSNPNPNPLLNLDMVWSRNLRSDPPADLTALVSNFPGVQNIQQQQQTVIMGHDQQQNSSTGNRNSKKRPRASRRAPTTVLTTDTTNFRAMVQEFTGIPAPPFTPNSSSISFPRNARFDLFNPSPSPSPSPSQPFLLRPFPQKPTFLSSNFLNNPNPNQNQNQNNLVFNIQNMFQKQGGSSSSSNLEIPNQTLKMGRSILDEFGLSHETLSLTRSDHSHSHNNNNITNPSLHPPPPPPANWVGDGSRNESNNYSNGRPTYSTTATASANSSEFLADKAAENNITTARSEEGPHLEKKEKKNLHPKFKILRMEAGRKTVGWLASYYQSFA